MPVPIWWIVLFNGSLLDLFPEESHRGPIFMHFACCQLAVFWQFTC